MIVYDTGKWGIAFAFHCSGSVFPKSLSLALPLTMLALLLHILLRHFDLHRQINAGSNSANLLGSFHFVLGFLLVFRSQQAYSRWWEGGTLLQELRGEWFNAFSCLVSFCSPKEEKRNDVLKFQHYLARLISLLYSSALKQVTTISPKVFAVIELGGFDFESLEFVHDCHDGCEVVLQWIQQAIGDADTHKTIVVAPPILSRVYNQLGNGIVKLSNARKIAKYPPPFPLAQMIAFMLFFHNILTVFMCSIAIESRVWSCAICFIVVLSFQSVNYIALELEMPFGDDPNDLPLQDMQRELNSSLIQMLRPESKRMPDYQFCAARAVKLESRETDVDKDLAGHTTRDSTRLLDVELYEVAVPKSVPEEKQQDLGIKESKSCMEFKASQTTSSVDTIQSEKVDVKVVIEQTPTKCLSVPDFKATSPLVPITATDARAPSAAQWTAITNALEALNEALHNHPDQPPLGGSASIRIGDPSQPNNLSQEEFEPRSNTEILLTHILQELQCNQHQLADFHNDIIGALVKHVNLTSTLSEDSQSSLRRQIECPAAGDQRQEDRGQPSSEFLC